MGNWSQRADAQPLSSGTKERPWWQGAAQVAVGVVVGLVIVIGLLAALVAYNAP